MEELLITGLLNEGPNAVKESNTNNAFKSVWRDHCSGARHIGHNNFLLDKYGIFSSEPNTWVLENMRREFIRCYMSDPAPDFNKKTASGSEKHGRSMEQVMAIADFIERKCLDGGITFPDGMETDSWRLSSLVVWHACGETVNGRFHEEIVRRYFENVGMECGNRTSVETKKWDSNGIDLFIYKDGLIIAAVQVKPVSFILGNSTDLIGDREKCFTKNVSFLSDYAELHQNEFHKNFRKDIKYCFYDGEDRKCFINFKDIESDDGVFVNIGDLCEPDGTAKMDKIHNIRRLAKVDVTSFMKD